MRAQALVFGLVLGWAACSDSGVMDEVGNGLPGVGDHESDEPSGKGGKGGKGGASDSDQVEDTDLPDAPTDASTWNHVLSALELLPSNQGADLNGDGRPDNALGQFAGYLPKGTLTQLLRSSGKFFIIQLRNVDNPKGKVGIASLSGSDADANKGNNFGGVGSFVVSSGVDSQGNALVTVPTTLSPAGQYAVTVPPIALNLNQISIPTAVPWRVQSTAQASGQSGSIATAIAVEDIGALLGGVGVGGMSDYIAQAADLDLDGDGTKDAISLALGFKAVPCTVVVP